MAIYVTRTGVALTVGIIILAGLLVGGLFFVKNAGEQARREEAVKIAEEQLNDQSNGDVASNGADENGTPEDESEESGVLPGTGATDSDDGADSSSSEAAGELPQTGPADVAVSIMGAGLIVFAGTSYHRSRQTLLEAR